MNISYKKQFAISLLILFMVFFSTDFLLSLYLKDFRHEMLIYSLKDIFFVGLIGYVFFKRYFSFIRDLKKSKEISTTIWALVDEMPLVVIFKNKKGQWLRINKKAMTIFGLENVDYEGKTSDELLKYVKHKESRNIFNTFQNQDEIIWKGGKFAHREIEYLLPNGKKFTLDVLKVPVFDNKGERLGMAISANDITHHKEMEEFMIESDKLSLIGNLAAGIAHEIKNPLTSLKGFIQLLNYQNEDESKGYYYDIMLSELERINTIVGEFLILAKPQASIFQKYNVGILIDEVLSLLITQANLKGIDIETNYNGDIEVECDKNQLKQVFINVIKNALESNPKDNKIKINVVNNDDFTISIKVKDTGVGIDSENLSEVGKPFFTTKEDGTGLGVLVSQKIIHQHFGQMIYDSEIGKGTTVEIKLPITIPNEKAI